MTGMGQHATASGRRRGLAAAWIVFLSMAGTTMTFQVYHSIKFGHMPWELAVLYGTVPLLISIGILEIVAEWHGSPWWAQAGAYLIMGGSMFLSATSTGDVVLRAAPPHWSLLFGFLLDGAALIAVHFILAGAPALSRMLAQEEDVRLAALEAERSAAARERAARAEAEAELETARGQLAATSARAGEAEAGRVALESERTARERAEADLAAAVSAREDAEKAAAEALTRAEASAQKLDAMRDREARKRPRASAQSRRQESAQGEDATTELLALMEMRADPELLKPRKGGELARRLGVHPSTGRRLHARLTIDGRLRDSLADRAPENPDARSGERS